MKPHILEDKSTPPEIRAYIYQQLTDLETLLPQGSALSITVQDEALLHKAFSKNTSKTTNKNSVRSSAKNLIKNSARHVANKNSCKKVVIYLETSLGNLISESKNKDIFKAIKVAKEDLKNQLATLHGVLIRSEERANTIETILHHPYLH